MRHHAIVIFAAATLALAGCASASRTAPATARGDLRSEVDAFLVGYQDEYQRLYTESSEAQWASNTRIVAGDTINAARTKRAQEALAGFVGSVENIERIRAFLARRDALNPRQVRQLEAMLYAAGDSPQTVPDIVRRRIAAETEQVERLYGYQFTLDGRDVTPNDLDEILRTSRDVARRRAAWEASKTVGATLKPGLVELRDLRNATVRGLGFPDYFSYQVSDYGMSAPEMLALTENLVAQLRPLYRELHTWARHELARRYDAPVPDLIPAHWLTNRWGQDWSDLVQVQGLNVDSAIALHTPEWVVRQGEAFYVSLGFDSLPQTFWERSSLYDLPADAPYKKNTHASAWHMDLDDDVRSLMSVKPNKWWFGTAHHELGHIYYYMSYSRPEVPLVLRGGANRAYHEGIGSMMDLASSQRRFLVNRGLVAPDAKVDSVAQLLKEALNYVVFIPWSAGTMTRFEHALYVDSLSPERFNQTWWDLVARYQGIAPPAPRGEDHADALTKTHINDDPGQYYDYALSFALLFQLHDHIARNILQQDPHDTDYYGNRQVGNFLDRLMAPGSSRPWRDVLRETTGRELDAQAMVDYFAPLMAWLQEQNRGRAHTLPEVGAAN
jgi:peptidyl-dipeptidase A